MKYVKILGLLAVAATAMMAFVATALATTVTSPTGTSLPLGSKIKAASENGHVTLHNGVALIECPSTVEGEITTNGITGTKASGPVNSLIFGTAATAACTNDWVVHVISKGTLSIERVATSGSENGTLYSSGATITTTRSGLECHYKTETTPLGTLTGGEHATLDIKASIPRHGGSFLCGGSTANWTGNYKVTSPTNLYIVH